MSLEYINDNIINCHKCPLYKTMDAGCTPVPGNGNAYAQIMIVGEAPGYNEMLEGAAFIGRCGKYLDKMLEAANIDRDSVYITNTVKCFPRENKKARKPEKYEVEACKSHLLAEIAEIKPSVIVTLGRAPAELLLNIRATTNIASIAGSIFEHSKNTIILPNWHPSFLMQYGKSHTEKAINVFRKAKQYITKQHKLT